MHRHGFRRITGFVGLVCLPIPVAAAPVSSAFVYQGQLKRNGLPVNGTLQMAFQLFDAAAGGSFVTTAIPVPSVVLTDGLFQVNLDFGTAPFGGEERYLQVTVDGVPLSPRQRLAATAYATYALRAANGSALDAADGSPANAVVVDPEGRVGIGTASPQAELHVRPGSNNPLGTLLVTPGAADSTSQIKLTENTSATLGSILRYDGAANQLQILGLSTGGVETLPHMVIGRDNGRVGIGTASPLTPLHVLGNARVDGTIFIPPTDRYLTIPAESFCNLDSIRIGYSTGFPYDLGATTAVSGDLGNAAGTDLVTFTAVNLPHGAVVTEFRASIYDNAIDEFMTAYLMREPLTGDNEDDIMAQVVSTNNEAGPIVQTDASILNATVDNANYLYRVVLEFEMPPLGDVVSCNWVRIKYTVTNPLP